MGGKRLTCRRNWERTGDLEGPGRSQGAGRRLWAGARRKSGLPGPPRAQPFCHHTLRHQVPAPDVLSGEVSLLQLPSEGPLLGWGLPSLLTPVLCLLSPNRPPLVDDTLFKKPYPKESCHYHPYANGFISGFHVLRLHDLWKRTGS